MPQKAETKFKTKAAQLIETEIKSFVRTSPLNRMPNTDNQIIFDEPLVQFADGNDPIFTEYKTIIAPEHFTPREALAETYGKNPEDMPARLSVISWILPAVEETRKSNRAETLVPSRLWSHTRWHGEKFNGVLREHMVEIFTEMGYLGRFMKIKPDTMPHEFPDDRTALGLRVGLDGPPDITQGIARLYHGNTPFEAIPGYIDNSDCIIVRSADEKCFVRIGIVSV